MKGKPLHYDGSVHKELVSENESNETIFELTDEMRKNIAGNPFVIEE